MQALPPLWVNNRYDIMDDGLLDDAVRGYDMRIIGGQWRGRRLFAPEGMETRPTSDKVREALFNIIRNDVFDARIWDVFAGSGALALEALSRGAEFAVLTDASRKAAASIKRNIELCGAQEQTRLLVTEWQGAVSSLKGQKFSLVFLDPPYKLTGAYADVVKRLLAEDMLDEDALIVMEHARDAVLPDLPGEVELCDTRRYGDTCLSLVRRRGAGE